MRETTIAARPTSWQDVILICRKCSKKLKGGFGHDHDQTLARALKSTLRGSPSRRSTRIIETKCLGICPKNAVTVLPATRPAEILSIPAGMDPAAILTRLLPMPEPSPRQTAAPDAAP